MQRRDLEKRAVEELESDSWLVQRALFSIKHLPNGRVISNQSDFFNVWDIMAVRSEECRLIQVCSGETFERHKKKITESFPETSWASQELWYYFKDRGKWQRAIFIRTKGFGWLQKPDPPVEVA